MAYAFQETMRPLKALEFDSEAGRKWVIPLQESWLGNVRIPIPRRFAEGIDLQKQANERPGKKNYLCGEFSESGWWYYYLYGMGIKLPLGTLALLAIAILLVLKHVFLRTGKYCSQDSTTAKQAPTNRSERGVSESSDSSAEGVPGLRSRQDHWRDVSLMLAPSLLALAFVSSQTEMNRHIRYAFLALPSLFVFASSVMPPFIGLRSRSHSRAIAALLCLAVSVASSLYRYPDPHAFFNLLAGGPSKGHEHLLSSNIDWGQQAFILADFVKEREQAGEQVNVFYFGPLSTLKILRIETEDPYRYLVEPSLRSPPPPGWYAISVELLHRDAERTGLGQFLRIKPVLILGYSINIYRVE
ncbi:MAG: hypothetical protein MPJ50_05035 [Pirellulales bacterium]|nr:hypothetical protein [Pirellulales bacterium]